MMCEEAKYLPVAFSDHFAHLITFSVPEDLAAIISPKFQSSFRLYAEVIQDQLFKERLAESVQIWENVLSYQHVEVS